MKNCQSQGAGLAYQLQLTSQLLASGTVWDSGTQRTSQALERELSVAHEHAVCLQDETAAVMQETDEVTESLKQQILFAREYLKDVKITPEQARNTDALLQPSELAHATARLCGSGQRASMSTQPPPSRALQWLAD